MKLYVFLLLGVVLNFWSRPGVAAGDPFRESRLRYLVMFMTPVIGRLLVKAGIPPLLCLAWMWGALLWAYWGLDSYGLLSVVLPPLFLLAGQFVVQKGAEAVWLALRCFLLFQSCLGLSQVFKWVPEMYEDYWRLTGPIGTLGQETLLGSAIAPLTIIALWRWSYFEAFLGFILCLLCDSTMTIVALGGAAVCALWKRVSIWAAIVLTTIGLAAVGSAAYFFRGGLFFHDSGRFIVWAKAWEHSQRFPLGWGPGSWLALYPKWDIPPGNPMWREIHFEPLEVLFHLGWPGLLLCSLYVAMTLWSTKNAAKATLIGGLVANSLGNFTFQAPVTALLMAIAVALPDDKE